MENVDKCSEPEGETEDIFIQIVEYRENDEHYKDIVCYQGLKDYVNKKPVEHIVGIIREKRYDNSSEPYYIKAFILESYWDCFVSDKKDEDILLCNYIEENYEDTVVIKYKNPTKLKKWYKFLIKKQHEKKEESSIGDTSQKTHIFVGQKRDTSDLWKKTDTGPPSAFD